MTSLTVKSLPTRPPLRALAVDICRQHSSIIVLKSALSCAEVRRPVARSTPRLEVRRGKPCSSRIFAPASVWRVIIFTLASGMRSSWGF